jgi:EAL domain-containing protein (putative c-di-GMP-specific phosphodiesterase class I)
MPEQLGQIVEAAGLCPEDWVIEVTESRLMVNRAVTLESLTRLSLMGMTLKMDVVAEGVETAEQLEFLRNSGCALVQGFFVARPMPFTACTDWISLEKGRAVKPAGFLDLPRRSPCSEST